MESTIAKIENLMMYRGAGCEAGKLELILRERDEQLKRKMWEVFKTECSSRIGIWINTPEGRIAGCDWVPSKMHETKCCIETCPIAEKLLKAVK